MSTRKIALGCVALSALAFAGMRCSDGDNGKSALVRVINETAGANCASGGFQVLAGPDDNRNGVLDDDEIESRTYSCSGDPGPDGGDGSVCNLRRGGACRNADLRNLVLLGYFADLTEADLSGSDLRNAVLINVSMTGANLSGAKLDNAFLGRVDLSNANLSNATATHLRSEISWLYNTNLVGTDLSDSFITTTPMSRVLATGARFQGARLNGALEDSDFSQADFTGAIFTNTIARSTFTGANLSQAQLSGFTYDVAEDAPSFANANLSFASLYGSNFSAVAATGAVFTNAYFDNATVPPTGVDLAAAGAVNIQPADGNLSGKDLRYARQFALDARNLSNANFAGVELVNATFVGSNMTGANFTDANLQGSNITNANFTGADLTNAVLDGMTLDSNTNFAGANLTRASLRGLAFGTVNMAGANLTHASLQGSNLQTVGMSTPITWTGAFRDAGTVVPVGATGLRSVVPGSGFAGADMSGVKLNNVTYTTADDFTGASFADATLMNVVFGRTTLVNANLTNVEANGTDFAGVDATGANFTGASVQNCGFHSANLANTNLTNADFRCSFMGLVTSDIGVPNLAGATFSRTVCADGSISDENASNCDMSGFNAETSQWYDYQCAP